jgi:hypothetical protein
MKLMTISLLTILILSSGLSAQRREDIRADMMAILKGDTESFERGMQGLEALMAKNPADAELKVLHGTGIFARSGKAFEKGDIQTAITLWRSSLDEMSQAVEMAPENVFVRARRGVILISASRSITMPEAMQKPLTQTAVDDFEKVLAIREKDQTLAGRSPHQRGELLTGLADGWNRLGNPEKARTYFERVTRELKGTVYEQKARAWLEGKPEAKTADYFACSGCHVE